MVVGHRVKQHIQMHRASACLAPFVAEVIKKILGYDGELVWDVSKPDGMPQKLMDSSILRKMGWAPKFNLKLGLEKTYKWYLHSKGQEL